MTARNRLDRLIAARRGALRRVAALSVAAGLIWPLQAGLVAWALGGALAGGGPILLPVLGFALLGLARAGLGLWADARAQALAQAVIGDLRAQIVTREAGFAPGQAGPGAVAALAGEKLAALAPWLLRYAPARARVMVLPLVFLALVLPFSWGAALILLISGPLIPVFMALVGLAAKEASARQLDGIAGLNDLLIDRLGAVLDIRVLGATRAVETGFSAAARGLRRRSMAVLRLAFLSSTVLELFAAIGIAMMAVYVGFSLLGALSFGAWGTGLTPEAGIFLLLLAPEFYQPLRDLAAAWHDRAAAEALAEDLDSWRVAPRVALPGQGARVAPLPGPASLALQDCRAASGLVLPDMAIAPGEAVALMGASGAGKTTALRLMAGLEAPAQGRVLVAGQGLTSEIADAWRARIGWMPQRPAFLTGSLRSNLALGRDGAALDRALHLAQAGTVVNGLPRGLATHLGETGGGLSGGEARRLTLARALAGAPDLILADEPTADLDPETAAAVTAGLLAARAQGVTLVVATHDPALAARMDRVIRLGAE